MVPLIEHTVLQMNADHACSSQDSDGQPVPAPAADTVELWARTRFDVGFDGV